MKELNEKIQAQFTKMCITGKLFRSKITGQEVWESYISAFENDPIFRDPNSTTHNCNLCKNFIRRYGNIVAIDPDTLQIMTIFDVVISGEFEPVTKKLSHVLKSAPIVNVFFETFEELNHLPYESCSKSSTVFQLGMSKNVKRYNKEEAEKFGVVKPNEIKTFHHLHLFVPDAFVDKTGKSAEALMGDFLMAKEVFQRGMETIPLDTLHLVRDLIVQGSLLDGQTHLYKVHEMITLKQEHQIVAPDLMDAWYWVNSYKFPLAKFRNELIGTLCVELAEGKEINEACQAWNKRVDPANYMKATAPITKKQIEEAKTFVLQNGYEASFNRRFANIDDIKVSEILHSNVGKDEVKSVSIFDGVKSTSTRHKRNEFEGVEEVGIEKFMKDILPSCSSIEVLLKNIHENHMVSLTTANEPESKPIFKWDNNYSWTFNGNLAGKSQIKQAVKDAGGNVEGVLNFRLAWNDNGQNDSSDLDAWAQEPNGEHIGFNTNYRSGYNQRTKMSGQLDVDNINPNGKIAVENITWITKNKMLDGVYKLWVNQYNARNSQGFKVEIEMDGETYFYEYNTPVRGNVMVAEVTLMNGNFSIKHILPESGISNKEIYGLESNSFHKVNLLCLSPNHWGNNNVGNKHYFFMLDGCKSPNSIRSFHNENLIPELLLHRKVTEVLGATNMIAPAEKQLSGLGFNATVRDELLVRISGSHKRMLKIKF